MIRPIAGNDAIGQVRTIRTATIPTRCPIRNNIVALKKRIGRTAAEKPRSTPDCAVELDPAFLQCGVSRAAPFSEEVLLQMRLLQTLPP